MDPWNEELEAELRWLRVQYRHLFELVRNQAHSLRRADKLVADCIEDNGLLVAENDRLRRIINGQAVKR